MIIEFTGIPGAGKTTLLPAAKEIIEEHGLVALSRWEAEQRCLRRTGVGRLVEALASARGGFPIRAAFYPVMIFSALKFSLGHPRFVRHVLASQRRRPVSGMVRFKALRRFFSTVARYELFQSHLRPREAVILDEGLVHQVINLYVSGNAPPNPEHVFRYSNLIPSMDLVIQVRAQPGGCLSRMNGRGMPNRLEGKNEQEVRSFMAHASSVEGWVTRGLREHGRTLMEIDNNGPLDQCRAGLRRGLERILRVPARRMKGDPASPPLLDRVDLL